MLASCELRMLIWFVYPGVNWHFLIFLLQVLWFSLTTWPQGHCYYLCPGLKCFPRGFCKAASFWWFSFQLNSYCLRKVISLQLYLSVYFPSLRYSMAFCLHIVLLIIPEFLFLFLLEFPPCLGYNTSSSSCLLLEFISFTFSRTDTLPNKALLGFYLLKFRHYTL